MHIHSIHIGRWIRSKWRLKCVGKDAEVMWYSSFPYPTQHHEAPLSSHKGERSTGKLSGRWTHVETKLLKGPHFQAVHQHVLITWQRIATPLICIEIASPQLLIWTCTVRIEFTSPQMQIQCEVNGHWHKVSCEWALRTQGRNQTFFDSCCSLVAVNREKHRTEHVSILFTKINMCCLRALNIVVGLQCWRGQRDLGTGRWLPCAQARVPHLTTINTSPVCQHYQAIKSCIRLFHEVFYWWAILLCLSYLFHLCTDLHVISVSVPQLAVLRNDTAGPLAALMARLQENEEAVQVMVFIS